MGRALMERIISKLLDDGVSVITLYAEPKVLVNIYNFYKVQICMIQFIYF